MDSYAKRNLREAGSAMISTFAILASGLLMCMANFPVATDARQQQKDLHQTDFIAALQSTPTAVPTQGAKASPAPTGTAIPGIERTPSCSGSACNSGT